jgi:two-component system chemotaxis response regulator CheB
MAPGTSGGEIRVVVAEESAALRSRMVAALRAHPGFDVVAETGDGRVAVDLCTGLRPDVVVLGLTMPGMNAPEAAEYLMRHSPIPILVVSGDERAAGPGGPATSARDGAPDGARAARAAGVVEVLQKPRAATPDGGREWDATLVATVRLVARIRVVTRIRSASAGAVPAPRGDGSQEGHRPSFGLLAIGASTGGPVAVATVLSGLPESFRLPVLLVVHVGEAFGFSFAEWLEDAGGRPVRLARHGEALTHGEGQVLMAPPGHHLVMNHGLLELNRGPERHSCRPSVDVLFESLAAQPRPRVMACLLSGMGRDGAAGLLAVHRAGGVTIAQDEASSVVYGMPGEAVRLGAAQHVLPVDRIGPVIGRLARDPWPATGSAVGTA